MAPFMDRDQVNKCSSQVGFIKFVLLPLFEALGELFPVIQVSRTGGALDRGGVSDLTFFLLL